MASYTLMLGGRSFPLAPKISIADLEADMLHAVRTNGAFVSVPLADETMMRCLVTAATGIAIQETGVVAVGGGVNEGQVFTSRHLRRV